MPSTTVSGQHVDIRLWTRPESVEPEAMRQLRNISALPWTFKHVAVMPDVHYGKGATVGSVIAMRDAVSPAAVGVDIGCGMTAVRTSLRAEDLPSDLSRLRSTVERVVPVGRGQHKTTAFTTRDAGDWDAFWRQFEELTPTVRATAGRALHQMGTLGGGNHFIEICLDTQGQVWVMLHSGSRGIGNILAQHHIEVAQGLAHNSSLPDPDLAVFLAGTPQMAAYRHDLYWAQDYARRNRAVMLRLVCDVLRRQFPVVSFDEPISAHHNYVRWSARPACLSIAEDIGGLRRVVTCALVRWRFGRTGSRRLSAAVFSRLPHRLPHDLGSAPGRRRASPAAGTG
ncbi:RtcB family protein [Actinophytocola sediminis]